MADPSVTERRIRPIQDAMNAGNLKQALKDCEKWQKKGESSDTFLALKAAVLVSQPDSKSQEKGRTEALALCDRKQPLTNVDAIYQLQDALRLLSLENEEGSRLWERAASVQPGDETLLITWLNSSISASSWQSAQKATTALKKAFPKERRYEYWNILMCYLINQDERLADKDRKLFGTLANRMIVKNTQSASATKLVHAEELSLLSAVVNATGSAVDLVNLLQDDSLQSAVAADPNHSQTLLLQALSKTDDADLVFEYCTRNLLNNQSETNSLFHDDRAWELCRKSADTDVKRGLVLTVTKQLLSEFPNHRQARLTRISLLGSNAQSTTDFLQSCKAYFDLFSRKAFCFDDLRLPLQKAGQEVLRSFKDTVCSNKSGHTFSEQLFVLKLDYCLLDLDEIATTEILVFTDAALRLSLTARSEDESVSTDAALLASLVLLRLATQRPNKTLLAQASLVLQTTLKHFKDSFTTRIYLLLLNMVDGQISLAMNLFSALSVKNIQWETTGHLLLTRISTLHPQQSGKGETSLNPLGALDAALTIFDRSQQSLQKAIEDGLKYQSYANVLNTISLRSDLQNSLVQQLYILEERKCQRVWNLPLDTSPLSIAAHSLVDLRDHSFLQDFGIHDAKVSRLLQRGPLPARGWAVAMHIHELIISYLTAEVSGDVSGASHAYSHLMDAVRSSTGENADMTPVEQLSHAVYLAICSIKSIVSEGQTAPSVNIVSEYLSVIRDWTLSPLALMMPHVLNGVRYADWQYLHTTFTALDTLQTIILFTSSLLKKGKTGGKNKASATQHAIDRDAVTALQKSALESVDQIHGAVKALKSGLTESGVLGRLVDGVLERIDDDAREANGDFECGSEKQRYLDSLRGLTDEASVEEYCSTMRDSWVEALDGILVVQVKAPK